MEKEEKKRAPAKTSAAHNQDKPKRRPGRPRKIVADVSQTAAPASARPPPAAAALSDEDDEPLRPRDCTSTGSSPIKPSKAGSTACGVTADGLDLSGLQDPELARKILASAQSLLTMLLSAPAPDQQTLSLHLTSLLTQSQPAVESGCMYAYRLPLHRVLVERRLRSAEDRTFVADPPDEWLVVKLGISSFNKLAQRLYMETHHLRAFSVLSPMLQSTDPTPKWTDSECLARLRSEAKERADSDWMLVHPMNTSLEHVVREDFGCGVGTLRTVEEWERWLRTPSVRKSGAPKADRKLYLGPREWVLCRRSVFEQIRAAFVDGQLPSFLLFRDWMRQMGARNTLNAHHDDPQAEYDVQVSLFRDASDSHPVHGRVHWNPQTK